MKTYLTSLAIVPFFVLFINKGYAQTTINTAIIIDHEDTDITGLSEEEINNIKNTLHIAYGHTSHGSQLTDGMTGLNDFANGGGLGLDLPQDIFSWSHDGAGETLHLFEGSSYDEGLLQGDCGVYPRWVDETVEYLGAPDANGMGSNNPEINVLIWAWCGQVRGRTEETLFSRYLIPMSELEVQYPGVTFVYMTGHLEGLGLEGILHQNNEIIRQYCIENDKVLYDFADIEVYDPDGNYYGDRYATDGCNYDFNGDGETTEEGDPARPISGDRNWATDWQDAHAEGVDWYNCGAAHSKPVNANMKAYAAWNLFDQIIKIHGEDIITSSLSLAEENSMANDLSVFPIPAKDILHFNFPENQAQSMSIFNNSGQMVMEENYIDNSVNISELKKGIYFLVIKGIYNYYKAKFIVE